MVVLRMVNLMEKEYFPEKTRISNMKESGRKVNFMVKGQRKVKKESI